MPQEQRPMYLAASRNPAESAVTRHLAAAGRANKHRCSARITLVSESCSTERKILDFLNGKTDGGDVLHALYDHVLDEPVPERLKALLPR